VRILIVGNLLSGSVGVRAQSEDLAERLSAAGHSVIATSTVRARVPRLADMLTTTWMRRGDYDVAIVDVFSGHAFLWAEWVCAALRRARKPYVLVLHGGNLPTFALRNRQRVIQLFASANAVVAPSLYLVNHMRNYRADIRVIPNAIHVSRYPFRLRQAAQPRLIWLRAFHRIYNPTLALEVMYRLNREYPEARLTMVGPDKHDGTREETEAAMARLQLGHCVALQGAMPKTSIPELLGSGDIFLNTSNIDNTPVTVVEAMAAGLCIVSTDPGGIADLIENDHQGVLVPTADPGAMADAVRRVLEDRSLSERLSQNARAKSEQFDWLAVLPMWTDTLRSASRIDVDTAAVA
jgi:glycosyltransferase involved in cell wall biosynthesis